MNAASPHPSGSTRSVKRHGRKDPWASVKKPNFFIVGAMKCGTTAWYEYLRTHPDIFMADPKEPCHFAVDLPGWRRVQSAEDYAQIFAKAGDAAVVGEASAIYLLSKKAAGEIHALNPNAKILILLRRQEEFLPSLHNQFVGEFAENIRDFATAWRLSGRRPAATIPETCVEPAALDYAAAGLFHDQVARYLDLFPAEQVRVLWFDDWVKSKRSTYLDLLEFLGVEDDGRADFPPVNEGVTYRVAGVLRTLHHPPERLRNVVRAIKRGLAIEPGTQARLISLLERLLSRKGYRRQIDEDLSREIAAHYAADNAALAKRLGTNRAATVASGADA